MQNRLSTARAKSRTYPGRSGKRGGELLWPTLNARTGRRYSGTPASHRTGLRARDCRRASLMRNTAFKMTSRSIDRSIVLAPWSALPLQFISAGMAQGACDVSIRNPTEMALEVFSFRPRAFDPPELDMGDHRYTRNRLLTFVSKHDDGLV
ncbi:MAG: hypothetical protein QOF66_1313 [Mycobacterium sp.]|jgi:hypothetical protein|nr:hypothetical protein [Mycobacterium sp.]